MNKKSICLSFMVLLAYSHLQAQDYPQNYFSSPLDTPLTLVGTFGEIRDDHFHSGIDLGTQELEGVPVSELWIRQTQQKLSKSRSWMVSIL
ncbi:MAG: hypothetical protein IPG90_04685 [Bacteroidetes bacterium]|nr:hypothetical protein [Bacteroidota bacterium]